MTIAGQTFTISQAGASCSYSIAPQSLSFDSQGGISNVGVSAPLGCTWTALSNAGWITINSGQSGNGTGLVRYAVAANVGVSRTGTMTIAGQTFTVTQGAASQSCSYSLTPASQSVPAGGAAGTISVTTGETCTWSVSSAAAWM